MAKFRDFFKKVAPAQQRNGQSQVGYLISNQAWEDLCRRADELEDEEDREAMEVFFAQTYRCTVDAQNRIVIPPMLRDYAQLEKDVVIVGANSVARIWNAQRWAEKVATYMTPQKMKSLARKVRL